MELQLIKYHPLFAYSVGDKFQVSEGNTKILLDGGYAVPVGSVIESPEDKLPPIENTSLPGMTTQSFKKNKKK